MSAAADAAATVLSYSYKTFDADRSKARGADDPQAREEVRRSDGEGPARRPTRKLTLKATVVAPGLSRRDEDRPGVLLFVNAVTTGEGVEEAAARTRTGC